MSPTTGEKPGKGTFVDETCRLCHMKSKLCKSHIIPEFFFRPMYDEKGIVYKISANPGDRTQFRQNGPKEKLLCVNCEQHINRFEEYAHSVFYKNMVYQDTGTPNEIMLTQLDYNKLKLFQLSILWRAAVASDPVFSRVSLGPHAERLRKMILSDDPGDVHEYGCILVGLMDEQAGTFDAVMQPEKGRVGGQISYRFIFGSCLWLYVVSNHGNWFDRKRFFLQKDGTSIMRSFRAKDVPFIFNSMQELYNMGKFNA